jgi:hypothetical protein
LEYDVLGRRSQAVRYQLDYIEGYVEPRLIDMGLHGADPVARTDLQRALIPVLGTAFNYADYPTSLEQMASEARGYLSRSTDKLDKSEYYVVRQYIQAVESCYGYFERVATVIECSTDICVSLGTDGFQVQAIHKVMPQNPIKTRELLRRQRPRYLID